MKQIGRYTFMLKRMTTFIDKKLMMASFETEDIHIGIMDRKTVSKVAFTLRQITRRKMVVYLLKNGKVYRILCRIIRPVWMGPKMQSKLDWKCPNHWNATLNIYAVIFSFKNYVCVTSNGTVVMGLLWLTLGRCNRWKIPLKLYDSRGINWYQECKPTGSTEVQATDVGAFLDIYVGSFIFCRVNGWLCWRGIKVMNDL